MEAIFSLGAVSAGQSGPTPGGGRPAGVTPANEVSLWRNKRRRKRKQVTQIPTYLLLKSRSSVQVPQFTFQLFAIDYNRISK